VIKTDELASHEKAWRKLKCILLSEKRQSEKTTTYMAFWKRQHYEGSKDQWLPLVLVAVGEEGRDNTRRTW